MMSLLPAALGVAACIVLATEKQDAGLRQVPSGAAQSYALPELGVPQLQPAILEGHAPIASGVSTVCVRGLAGIWWVYSFKADFDTVVAGFGTKDR